MRNRYGIHSEFDNDDSSEGEEKCKRKERKESAKTLLWKKWTGGKEAAKAHFGRCSTTATTANDSEFFGPPTDPWRGSGDVVDRVVTRHRSAPSE
jgi:hypothetical protein